jgi:hypothetical protein
MALFGGDKKKSTEKPAAAAAAVAKATASTASDFDSPVESVQLPLAKKPMRGAAPTHGPEDRARELDGYGIEQAIQLMRLLPGDSNIELVVQVVKKTLESTNILVPAIIEDASRKQKNIDSRVSELEREIGDFEREVANRTAEIERLQTDHKETTWVKERLQLAEQLACAEKPVAPAAPAHGGLIPPPLPDPTRTF